MWKLTRRLGTGIGQGYIAIAKTQDRPRSLSQYQRSSIPPHVSSLGPASEPLQNDSGSSFNFRFHPAPSDRANRCRALSVWESSLPGFQRTDRKPAPPGCVVHTRGARTDVNDCSIRHGTPGCKHRAWSLEVVQHIFVEGGCLSC